MEVRLRPSMFEGNDIVDGYSLVPWRHDLLRQHADAKFLSFQHELDSQLFPCLGEREGCRRLMGEISKKSGFLPQATWLVARNDALHDDQSLRDRTQRDQIQRDVVPQTGSVHGLLRAMPGEPDRSTSPDSEAPEPRHDDSIQRSTLGTRPTTAPVAATAVRRYRLPLADAVLDWPAESELPPELPLGVPQSQHGQRTALADRREERRLVSVSGQWASFSKLQPCGTVQGIVDSAGYGGIQNLGIAPGTPRLRARTRATAKVIGGLLARGRSVRNARGHRPKRPCRRALSQAWIPLRQDHLQGRRGRLYLSHTEHLRGRSGRLVSGRQ